MQPIHSFLLSKNVSKRILTIILFHKIIFSLFLWNLKIENTITNFVRVEYITVLNCTREYDKPGIHKIWDNTNFNGEIANL